MKHCKDASFFLQNSKNSLGDAVHIIDTIVENITALKNDEIYGHLETILTDFIIEHDINEYEKPKRKVNLPIHFFEQILEPTVEKRDDKDFKTAVFHPLVDRCLSELQRRFSLENRAIMDGISALTPNSANFCFFIESFADLYDSNLLDLDLEVKNIGRMLIRKAKDEYPSGLFEFYMLTNRLRDINHCMCYSSFYCLM